jgi:sugar phosphate isomerase/epimerase
MVDKGYQDFADRWNPIMDAFDKAGVKFALEVHPTEIAYDIVTAKRTLEAIGRREAFGFNFDPSHLLWQGVDPARFIQEFPDRIYHVHMKDAATTLDGYSGILGSHLGFGAAHRGWDFRSLGHGDVEFESIIRELNRINYQGPLSVEWEDSGMDREFGAAEACEFVRRVDFPASNVAFDAAFEK